MYTIAMQLPEEGEPGHARSKFFDEPSQTRTKSTGGVEMAKLPIADIGGPDFAKHTVALFIF